MSDDEILDGEGLEEELDVPELEAEELDDEGIDLVDDFAGDELESDEIIDDAEDGDAATPETVARKAGSEDDDEDEDLRTEDDVEADLDAILREKLTAADETPLEDDEEEVVVDDKTDGLERLQPRRPDEIQCTQCFLLVRKTAPGCPVEDDACPLFVA